MTVPGMDVTPDTYPSLNSSILEPTDVSIQLMDEWQTV